MIRSHFLSLSLLLFSPTCIHFHTLTNTRKTNSSKRRSLSRKTLLLAASCCIRKDRMHPRRLFTNHCLLGNFWLKMSTTSLCFYKKTVRSSLSQRLPRGRDFHGTSSVLKQVQPNGLFTKQIVFSLPRHSLTNEFKYLNLQERKPLISI